MKSVDATEAVNACEAELKSTRGAWRAIWDQAGVSPLQPDAMLAWLEAVERIRQRREELSVLRDDCSAISREVETIIPALRQLLGDAGIADASAFDTEVASNLLEERLRKLTYAWNKTRQIEAKLSDPRSIADLGGRNYIGCRLRRAHDVSPDCGRMIGLGSLARKRPSKVKDDFHGGATAFPYG